MSTTFSDHEFTEACAEVALLAAGEAQLALDFAGNPLAICSVQPGADKEDLEKFCVRFLPGYSTCAPLRDRIEAELLQLRQATEDLLTPKRMPGNSMYALLGGTRLLNDSPREALTTLVNSHVLPRYSLMPKHSVGPQSDIKTKEAKARAARVAEFKKQRAARAKSEKALAVT